MPKQPAFPGLTHAMKTKRTRRKRLLLAEMDVVVPWGRLLSLIDPHYPKAGQHRHNDGQGSRQPGLGPTVTPARRRRHATDRATDRAITLPYLDD